MPIAAMLSGAVHQPLDLARGEIASLDCQVYDAWCALLGCRFHADKLCLRASYCIGYTHLLNSQSSATSLGIAAHATILEPVQWSRLRVRSARPPLKQTTCARLCGRVGGKLVRQRGGGVWVALKVANQRSALCHKT